MEFAYASKASGQLQQESQRIAADPVAFLRRVSELCQALESYEVDFSRQERLGLFVQNLKPEEHMRVKFRAHPFSVRMDMLDEDNSIAAVAFIEGWNRNRLRCWWRRREPSQPQAASDYDPQAAVTFGFSRHPITHFGIATLMRLVVGAVDEAIQRGAPPRVVYLGVTELEKEPGSVHHVAIHYTQDTRYGHRKVDLLFHVGSLLPAGSYVWKANGQLDGKYIYTNYQVDVRLSDGDFQTPPSTGA